VGELRTETLNPSLRSMHGRGVLDIGRRNRLIKFGPLKGIWPVIFRPKTSPRMTKDGEEYPLVKKMVKGGKFSKHSLGRGGGENEQSHKQDLSYRFC